ncbi:type II secretion system protein [Candidatus Saccharibacteria bacterium]|nr:type II secretion system protein [Candidatus Saccharibacteria bacterium]
MSIKSKKGFTIIEVVLVLAIAGLIFLMVFIALPAMQRNQRDTQRRNDYGALSAALTQYMNNNNGKLPIENASTAEQSNGIYLNPVDFVNTTGTNSNGDYYEVKMLRASNTTGWTPASPKVEQAPTATSYTGSANKTVPAEAKSGSTDVVDQVFIYTNADCSDTTNGYNAPKYNKSRRAFAIFGALESGTGFYCSASNS